MCKRLTKHQRINQSWISREALIASLTVTLQSAEGKAPQDQIDRLKRRIEELKRRQEDPGQSLGRGQYLYWRFAAGGEVASGGW